MDIHSLSSFLDRIADLSSGGDDGRRVAVRATELALEILGLDSAAILVGSATSRPEILHNQGVDASYLRFVLQQYASLPGARIIGTGRPEVVVDVQADPAYSTLSDLYRTAGIRGMVLFPLRQSTGGLPVGAIEDGKQLVGEMIGLLGVYHPAPVSVEPLQLALTQCLAAQTSALLYASQLAADRHALAQRALLERSHDVLQVMTAGIAHDFNNVLGAVLGLVSLWPYLDDEKRRKSQDELEAHVEAAAQLTRSLLEVARPAPRGAREDRCDVVAAASRAIAMARTTAHLETKISLESPVRTLWAGIDRSAFSRILLNLLLNCVQALGDRADGRVVVRVEERGDLCVVEVDDNGPGIAVGVEAQIFEPYASFGKEKGTGMGLAAARGLAERVGGTLTLKHRSGPGACFAVTLPKAGPARERVPVTPPPPPVRAGRATGRVLVADDDTLQRTMFASALRDMGFEVVEAASGTVALERIAAEAFDGAVLDQRMPGATGLAVLRKLRAEGRGLPVVLVSGFDVEQQDLAGPEFDRTRVVRKPIAGDSVAAMLRELLEAAGGSAAAPRPPGRA